MSEDLMKCWRASLGDAVLIGADLRGGKPSRADFSGAKLQSPGHASYATNETSVIFESGRITIIIK
jgi:uncharacterized protein YjbI with pentapeptide repeats